MSNQEIENLLNPLIGQTVVVDNQNQKFEGFAINGTKVTMSFTDTVMPIKFGDLEMFVATLNSGSTSLAVVAPPSSGLTIVERTATELSSIILDNIRRVKEDSSYIPQAEAVNNQLKTLIDLGKAEIEMKKTMFLISKTNLM